MPDTRQLCHTTNRTHTHLIRRGHHGELSVDKAPGLLGIEGLDLPIGHRVDQGLETWGVDECTL